MLPMASRRNWLMRGLRSYVRSKHMQTEVTEHGVAIIRIDCEGEKQNSLSMEMIDEFDAGLTRLETDNAIKAAVFISGKKDSWIAGANIKMIEGLTDAKAATDTAGLGQQAMDRIAKLQKSKPMVAAIDGACLGGGLEVALSCSYRVATTSPKTVLGLPEVMIGLLPGSGGTQRLPKLVGAAASLDMMLTGKQLKADRAKKMGLIDLVVDPSALERSAISSALQLASGELKPKSRKLGWMDWALEKTPMGRSVMFNQASKKVMKMTKGKYPAPLAIIECAKAGLEQGHDGGSKIERERFGQLAVTPEAKALRGLFFGQTECKKNTFADQVGTFPKVDTLAVIGAGLMGAGIAEVTASKGVARTLLKDRDVPSLARGQSGIEKSIGKKLKKRRLTRFQHDSQLASIVGLVESDPSWVRHFSHADLVIEAVFESLEVKHAVVKEMESVCPERTIIASNTSTIPIGDIATAAQRPGNVVGMHYFSPVPLMPLLEVIPHAGTDPAVVAAAVDVGIRQGKTVIVVKDVPGFYVNRCLGPFLAESMAVVQQGADPIAFNKAMVDFGYPVGGLTLADEVGIDVTQKVIGNLVGEGEGRLGVRMEGSDLGVIDEMVAAGFLGKKAGKGWFDHTGGKKGVLNKEAQILVDKYRHPTTDISKLPVAEVFERCFLRFVGEAIHCLQDEVIASPRMGDIGAVFGVGFPPFIGGPFMWIDKVGAQTVVDKMERLQQENGEQFAPPQLLVDYAKAGKRFYG
jgi:enoyl-CoA hydratase/long-chain 3-hydroxyacyl-CoA dehydrogenase